jgi:hypothetical protein
MLVKEYLILLLNGCLGVQDLGEVKLYPDMNVSGSRSITANVFEEKFWFSKVEALRVNELRVRIRELLALAHFEEAVDDEDEFREIGGKSSDRHFSDLGHGFSD